MSLARSLNLSAVACVAAFATAPAHAVLYTVSNSLVGDFAITGFADADPFNYSFSFTNLVGDLKLYVPESGQANVAVGGDAMVDWGGVGSPVTISAAPLVDVFSGILGISGATPGYYSFMFGDGSVKPSTGGFEVTYDGSTTNAIVAAIAAATNQTPTTVNGTGTLAFTYEVKSDSFTVGVVELPAITGTWRGFAGLLAGLDAQGNRDGQIDGNFALTNVQAQNTEVPEPASLALLGIGAMGLFAARRRKQA